MSKTKQPFPYWSIPLWVLTFVSLALNVLVITELIELRRMAQQSVEETIQVVEALKNETFAYNFVVEDVIDVNMEIPFQETIDVPIRDSIPINTAVNVPVNAGVLGTFNVNIPISTVIPIELDVAVEIDKTVEVRAAVPIEVDVPVSIAIADTPLSQTLNDLEVELTTLNNQLSAPLVPGVGNAEE